MSNLKEISAVILNVNHLVSVGKSEFAKFIVNKDITLADRWDLFCNTTPWFKEHEPYVVKLNWEKVHGKIDWYDEHNTNRYALVKMEELVESMYECDYSDEKITDMQEEILAKNLHSFVYDW